MTDQALDVGARNTDVVVGARLRRLRRERQLSQAELGGERFSGSYVSHVEKGRRRLSGDLIDYFAGRLGLPAVALLEDQPAVPAPRQRATSRVVPYHDVQRAFAEHRFAQAARAAGQAAELARDEGDQVDYWSLQLLRAKALFENDQLAEAAGLAVELADDDVVADTPRLRVEALLMASRSSRYRGDLVRSTGLARQAESLLAPAADPDLRAEVLVVLVGALVETGQREQARAVQQELLELLPSVTSNQLRGIAHWTIGNLAWLDSDLQTGTAHHDEAEARLSPLADLRLWARFRKAVAVLRLENGITDGVLELLERSGDALRVIDNASDLTELRLAEATLWLLEGDFTRSRKLVGFALQDENLRSAGHTRGDAEMLLARVELAEGRSDAAARAFVRAALDYERSGAYPRSVDAWRRHAGLVGVADDSSVKFVDNPPRGVFG